MVNPTTETKKTHLMPNRPASQPVSGVMIAAATMYEVTTQAIWSCEQLRLPWMCGSATLAIVVSTPCMIVAQVIEAVIATRLIRGPGASSPNDAAASPVVLRLRIGGNVGQSLRACNRPHRARAMCRHALARNALHQGGLAGVRRRGGTGSRRRQRAARRLRTRREHDDGAWHRGAAADDFCRFAPARHGEPRAQGKAAPQRETRHAEGYAGQAEHPPQALIRPCSPRASPARNRVLGSNR